MVQYSKIQSMAIKRILKINNSWPELFNFQNSFNCHWMELLRTAHDGHSFLRVPNPRGNKLIDWIVLSTLFKSYYGLIHVFSRFHQY